MAKEKEQELNIDLDEFMNSLAKSSSKKERVIERYNLAFPDTKGNYFYILFPSKGNKFVTDLGKCKEFKGFSTKKGKDVWFTILNKKDYGEMTEDQVKLYDEVIRLYSQVEKLESSIDPKNWQLKHTRYKTYNLIFAHVIKFINHDSGVLDKDKINKAAMLVFPSGKYGEAFSGACTTKTSIMGNNKWMFKILTNDPKNREAIITTDFYGGQGGYNCTVQFEMDKDAVKSMLPENYDFTNEKDVFAETDIIKEFLSWQSDENQLFNEEIFKEIRLRLLDLIHPAVETPLANQVSTNKQVEQSVPAPNAVSTVDQVNIDSDDLPF